MAEKMQRWIIQVVIPEGAFNGADEVIEELTDLVEGASEIEIVSAELDNDQTMGDNK